MFERFTREARVVVIDAREEAKALQAPRIESEHVLLGVLATADGPLGQVLRDAGLNVDDARAVVAGAARGRVLGEDDAEALGTIGIDLDAVRESLESAFGTGALDRGSPEEGGRGWFGRKGGGHIAFSKNAKKSIELALREAIVHKDDRIGPEHILLGVLRAAEGTTLAVVEARIPVDELRRRVLTVLGRAA